MIEGKVDSIHIADQESAPMVAVPSAKVHLGLGIEGDRYFKKTGSFSDKPKPGREVTLIEVEAIEAMKRDQGIEIHPGDARRNIVTRSVPLNHLVGKEFAVGEVVLRGVGLCEPCSHLAKLTQKEVLMALVHRGGLRAEIVKEGVIHIGDRIEVKF